MKRKLRALSGVCAAVVSLSACSDDGELSGKYVAEVEGIQMVIDFIDEGTATFAMGADGDAPAVDCTYQAGEMLISLNCIGSSGISLTKVDGGLEANMGGTLVRYERQ